jgi:hypothetical protein
VFSWNFVVNRNQHCCFAHGPAPSSPRPAHAFTHGPNVAHPDRTPPFVPIPALPRRADRGPPPPTARPCQHQTPAAPSSSFPPRGAPEPTPPIFFSDAARARSFFPSIRTTRVTAQLRRRSSPSAGSPSHPMHPRRPELLQQGATTEHHGAPKLPARTEPASSTRWCPIRLRSTRPHTISVSRPPPAVPLPFPPPASRPCRRPLVSTTVPPLSAVGGRLAGLARLRPRLAGRAVSGWAALAGRYTPHCCCRPKASSTAGFYFSNTFPYCLINKNGSKL